MITEQKLKKIIKEELDDYMMDNLTRLYYNKEHRSHAMALLSSLDEEDKVKFLVAIQPWRKLLPDNLKTAEPEDLIKMRLTDVSKSSRTNRYFGHGGILIKRTFDIELNGQKIGTFVVDGSDSQVEFFGKKAPKSATIDWNDRHLHDKKFKGYVIYEPRPRGKNNKKNFHIEKDGLRAYGGLMLFFRTKTAWRWFNTKPKKDAIEQYKGN